MPFDRADEAALDRAKTVRIETAAPGGPVHRTTIWIVVHDGRVFIRSHRGPRARWYREAISNPNVAIHAGARRIPATAVPATDADSIDQTSAGIRSKYEGDPSSESMCRDEILGTTLRLDPRSQADV
jgi:hypothetical protein